MKEAELQKAIVTYLDNLIKLGSLSRSLYFYHVPNESNARMSIGWFAKRKSEGVKAGVPDLILMTKGGVTTYIELKVSRAKLRDSDGYSKLSVKQRDFKEICEVLGNKYHIICVRDLSAGINEIEKILKEIGVLK